MNDSDECFTSLVSPIPVSLCSVDMSTLLLSLNTKNKQQVKYNKNKQLSLEQLCQDNTHSFTFIWLKVNLLPALSILLILYVLNVLNLPRWDKEQN